MAISNNVRSVIELFCKILGDSGISDVRAESLRQGKFNRNVITKQLWRVLYDVTCFLDKTVASSLHISEAEQVSFVKRKLQNWGYLSKSFAEIPTSLTFGSRDILLGLGWVIHTQHLFDTIVQRRTSPLHQDILSFTQNVAVDGLFRPIHLRGNLPSKERLQRQLMLCGKLKLKLRRLYASQQELVKCRQTIQKCTVGVSIQPELNFLTPLEVYLLRYPDSLDTMIRILEDDNAKMKRLMEWKEKEHVFWEWMDSVLTLHIQEKESGNDNAQDFLDDDSVYLEIPPDIGEQISHVRTCVRDFILSNEENIDRLERLVTKKKISHIELELINHQVEKELFELSHKFAQYDQGKLDVPVSSNQIEGSVSGKVYGASQSVKHNDLKKGQRYLRYVPHTAQSIKADKEAEVSEMMRIEISSLQNEVDKLEQELKEAQINSLKRLQGVTEQDVSSICILPRHFKQFLNSS